jgi:hypothetical protein
MMKKKTLFGTIFFICILMLVNTSSAVEYKTVKEYNMYLIESNLENINNFLEKIRQTLDETNINLNNFIYKNEIIELSEKIHELKISILDNSALSTFVLKILGFILSILFSLIGTIIGIIFGKIFGPLLVLILRILTAPAVLLAKVIAFILNLINP